jgi:hypothetical protein
MAKKNQSYKTIRTIEGIKMHLYEYETGKHKPHSQTEAAIQYPKGINKPDEYYLYGIKYSFNEWLELSRSSRTTESSEDLQE